MPGSQITGASLDPRRRVADFTRSLARAERAIVLVHVARDEQPAQAFNEALAFAAPETEISNSLAPPIAWAGVSLYEDAHEPSAPA
jgi:hypothetical protein